MKKFFKKVFVSVILTSLSLSVMAGPPAIDQAHFWRRVGDFISECASFWY